MKRVLRLLFSGFVCAAVLTLAGCNGATTAFPGYLQALNRPSVTRLTSGYATLYSFQGGPLDGAQPERHLLAVNGSLFGITAFGGGTKCFIGCGALFAITRGGEEHALYTFKGYPDGFYPDGGLVHLNGEFYGTTRKGGSYDRGIVFKVDASGTEQILHSFYKITADGAYPESGLTYLNGAFYGTTHGGGSHDHGTVFKIAPSGKETVIYAFGSNSRYDGAWPAASLLVMKGALYGTTTGGGKYQGRSCSYDIWMCGTVFKVTPSGQERVIYDFRGPAKGDGAEPVTGLTAVNGDLYGTTVFGGDASCYTGYFNSGCGVVFRVTTAGVAVILHRFHGGADGAEPQAGLAYVNRALYGTTLIGSASRCCGTVFKITPAGTETVMHRFDGNGDGLLPRGGLTEIAGILYGTTAGGGAYRGACIQYGCGTVYEIRP